MYQQNKGEICFYPVISMYIYLNYLYLYKYTTNYKYTYRCTNNKNTLTGPVNCKKTTRQHAHISLCTKSSKRNDAKPRKWPKT